MSPPFIYLEFIIKTDPQNYTYDFFSGLRKMEQEYETGIDDNVMKLTPDEIKQQLNKDAIFRLEYDNELKAVAQNTKKRLDNLIDLNEAVNKNDYDIN